MYTEKEKRARFFVVCVNEFALAKKLDKCAAFRYLYNNKGLQFLKDHYEIEHTLSLQDTIADLTQVCKLHGGQIA